jgi:Flp pilus assembly protein TadG
VTTLAQAGPVAHERRDLRGAATTSPPMSRRLRGSEGQAIVEFVIVLPLVVTFVFVLVQFGITFNNYLRVTDAARVAARAAAVARFNGNLDDPCRAARDAVAAASSDLVLQSCSTSGRPGDPVTITVTHRWSVSLPLLPLSESGDLKGAATERLE